MDSFNLPIFIPTASEVAEAASKVGGLSVEMVEEIQSLAPSGTPEEIAMCNSHLRAVFEDILCQQFGSAVTDVVFKKLPDKLQKYSKMPSFINSRKVENLFMLVKKTVVSV